jgi:hypothetical protein
MITPREVMPSGQPNEGDLYGTVPSHYASLGKYMPQAQPMSFIQDINSAYTTPIKQETGMS